MQWLTVVSMFVERQIESERIALSRSLSVATRRLGVSEGKLMGRKRDDRLNDVRALEYVNGAITGALAGLFAHDKIITELSSRTETVAHSITRTTESGAVKVQFFPVRHSLRTICSQGPGRFVLKDVVSDESAEKGVSRLRDERLQHALLVEFELSSEKFFVLACGSMSAERLSPWMVDALVDFASALESLLELAFATPEQTKHTETISFGPAETERSLTAKDKLRLTVGRMSPERSVSDLES